MDLLSSSLGLLDLFPVDCDAQGLLFVAPRGDLQRMTTCLQLLDARPHLHSARSRHFMSVDSLQKSGLCLLVHPTSLHRFCSTFQRWSLPRHASRPPTATRRSLVQSLVLALPRCLLLSIVHGIAPLGKTMTSWMPRHSYFTTLRRSFLQEKIGHL